VVEPNIELFNVILLGSVETQLNVPWRFGGGTYFSRMAEVIRLRRLAGMRLLGNGCPVRDPGLAKVR
jgi:hypothetical protein